MQFQSLAGNGVKKPSPLCLMVNAIAGRVTHQHLTPIFSSVFAGSWMADRVEDAAFEKDTIINNNFNTLHTPIQART